MKLSLLLLALILSALLVAPLSVSAQTAGPVQPAGTQAPSAGAQVAKAITVKVALETGASGEAQPAELNLAGHTVTLYALAGQSPAYTREAKTDARGAAEFSAAPYQDGFGFGVVARVGLTTYISQLATPAAGASEVRVPVRIYPTTTDTSKLRISQAYVLVEAQNAGKLDIKNLYLISNDGDKTVEGGLEDTEGKPASLTFPLPSGAEGVKFDEDDGSGMALAEGGFVARPGVPPGEGSGRVLVSYSLPYSDSLQLAARLAYPIDKLTVFVATQGITLTSPFLTSLGPQQRGDGVTMNAWGAEKIAAGRVITYDLNGKPQPPVSALSNPLVQPGTPAARLGLLSGRRPDELLGMGLIAAGMLVAIAAAGWWLVRSRFAPDPLQRQEHALLAALADLEEDQEAGRVGQEDYEQRRALLAGALASLVAPASQPEADAL